MSDQLIDPISPIENYDPLRRLLTETLRLSPLKFGLLIFVADVLVDGSSVGAVTSHTFTNVTAGHTIAASFALTPVSAKLDLTNPSTGNPADEDAIIGGTGDTITVNIKFTAGTDSVVSTKNDIAYDTNVFENPQATIGPVGTDAGKSILSSSPTAGVFRVAATSFSNEARFFCSYSCWLF